MWFLGNTTAAGATVEAEAVAVAVAESSTNNTHGSLLPIMHTYIFTCVCKYVNLLILMSPVVCQAKNQYIYANRQQLDIWSGLRETSKFDFGGQKFNLSAR